MPNLLLYRNFESLLGREQDIFSYRVTHKKQSSPKLE